MLLQKIPLIWKNIFMKITNEIYQIGGGGITSPEDAAVYLINFDGHAAIIDAGCGYSDEMLLKNIASCGVVPEQVEFLLITHCHFDHTGGAKALSESLQCKIITHELDAKYLEEGDDMVTAAKWYGASIQPFHVDTKISGLHENLYLGDRTIEAIHIPGHSPGSVAYLTESDGLKVLFGQDIHGPLDPGLLSNREDYLKSLQRLIGLEADILCEGHFGIFKGKNEVVEFIRSYMI